MGARPGRAPNLRSGRGTFGIGADGGKRGQHKRSPKSCSNQGIGTPKYRILEPNSDVKCCSGGAKAPKFTYRIVSVAVETTCRGARREERESITQPILPIHSEALAGAFSQTPRCDGRLRHQPHRPDRDGTQDCRTFRRAGYRRGGRAVRHRHHAVARKEKLGVRPQLNQFRQMKTSTGMHAQLLLSSNFLCAIYEVGDDFGQARVFQSKRSSQVLNWGIPSEYLCNCVSRFIDLLEA
jgi:hypothetical protein